jgi:hypothetical protein
MPVVASNTLRDVPCADAKLWKAAKKCLASALPPFPSQAFGRRIASFVPERPAFCARVRSMTCYARIPTALPTSCINLVRSSNVGGGAGGPAGGAAGGPPPPPPPPPGGPPPGGPPPPVVPPPVAAIVKVLLPPACPDISSSESELISTLIPQLSASCCCAGERLSQSSICAV